jgi:hypothetical protein
MSYALRPGKPLGQGTHRASDSNLAEALESIYALTDELALEWNGVALPLSYKFGLSAMVGDLLPLLAQLRERDRGERELEWASAEFPYHWLIRWEGRDLSLTATGRDEPGATPLTGGHEVRVDRADFVAGWVHALRPVLAQLRARGYTAEQLEDFALLDSISS